VGTIVLDLNLDGKPDVITGQTSIRQAAIKGRIYVLQNNMSTRGRSHVFYLQGDKANAQGLGAMVMLYTKVDGKSVVQRRWNELTQGGLASQLPEGVRFGVAEEGSVLGVKVRWPIVKGSGTRASGLPLERMYQIRENPSRTLQEWTLCEDGRIISGRFRCRSN
jgi:hypothetical protein